MASSTPPPANSASPAPSSSPDPLSPSPGQEVPPKIVKDEEVNAVLGSPPGTPVNTTGEEPKSEDPSKATNALEDELIAETEPTKTEERSGLRKLLASAIGTDLTSMAVPVTYNEPLSFLQRMCEYLQYHDLLQRANSSTDPHVRMLLVTTFAVTCFAGTDRKVKPFNPLLGETFEFVDEKLNFKFFAEQVSHHPPIGASHCETDDFVFYQTQSVKTKFLGNSLDVTPIGVAHVILKRTNEHYHWPNIRTLVNNLIIGSMWVDHFGECPVTVLDNTTNQVLPVRGDLNFKRCGWFGRGWHEIEGNIVGEGNIPYFQLSGKWTEQVSATPTVKGKTVVDQASGFDFSAGKIVEVWKLVHPMTQHPSFIKYEWTDVTVSLVKIDDEIRKQIPLTDARLREDRYWLQEGDVKKASNAKHILEDAQRARKRNRDAANISWSPRYFKLLTDADGNIVKNSIGLEQWIAIGNYWTERDTRIQNHTAANKISTLELANKFWRQQKD